MIVAREQMDEREMTEALAGLLELAACGDAGDGEFEAFEDLETDTFEQAGLLTDNKGLVVTMADGSAFQVTVVRVR